MSEYFIKWRLKQYLEQQGYRVEYRRIRIANFEIDGEAFSNNGERIAIEIKSKHDDICRGIGQLCEALAHGYSKAILATSLRKAKKLDRKVFEYFRILLAGIDGSGRVQFLQQEYSPNAARIEGVSAHASDFIFSK